MSSWNDDRSDELSRRTEDSMEIRQLISQVFTREEMNQRFDRLQARFDRINSILIFVGGIVAAVLVNGIFA